MERKKLYEKNLSMINDFTEKNFHDIELIKKIETRDKSIKNKLYNFLFEDYMSFIVNNDIKTLLKIIINHKFNCKNKDINNLSLIIKITNWLETYLEEYLIPIINFFLFLQLCEIKDVFILLEKNINESFINMNKIKEINENEKILNESLYYTISSLIKIFFQKFSGIIGEIKDYNSFKYLVNNLVTNLESLKIVNGKLNLNCKNLILFEELIKIMKFILNDENTEELENKKNLLLDFINLNKVNDKPLENEIITKTYKDYLDNLKKIFESHKTDYSEKLLSSILIDELKKETDEENKKNILQNILFDENLIENNILFLMENIFPIIKLNIDALYDISSNEKYFPLFNESEKIEKSIIKIFDFRINLYFDSLENNNNYTTELFDIFKNYLNILTNENDQDNYYKGLENRNLVKLYSISYIKIYLIKFIEIILENKNELKGKENDIIEEIIKTNSFKNTLFIYLIILLYNKSKNKNFEKFLEENISEVFKNNNELKKVYDENKYKEILDSAKIPGETNFIFSEYFNEIEFPSLDNSKEEFLSSDENKMKYPMIWSFINNIENLKNLKYLLDYNDFIDIMKSYYSGKISRKDAINEHLNEQEIFKDKQFKIKLDKFKNIYNNILFTEDIDRLNENDKLAYFLIDDNEKHDYGIKLKKGYEKFINWQNSFLKPIIESEGNKYLQYYKSSLKLEVDIQKANKSQIIIIDDCFKNTSFINFKGLITLYSKRKNNYINQFEYDFDIIEEELSKIILPKKCLFNEKNFDYIIYQYEYSNMNNDYLINFGKKYESKELDENDKKIIYKYIEENYKQYPILEEQFIILINYLANKSKLKKESTINDCMIETKDKYVNFNNIIIEFFSREGKEITIAKLLRTINYIELLCFDKLKNEINNKYKRNLDSKIINTITEYFEKEYKDKTITKKEIAIALRRFILKILLNEKREGNIISTSLYTNLYRKDLWNIKIFIKYPNDSIFKEKIKKYLSRYSLETNDSLGFYNIIGKEELDEIKKEKNSFGDVEEKHSDNLNLNFLISQPINQKAKKVLKKKKNN